MDKRAENSLSGIECVDVMGGKPMELWGHTVVEIQRMLKEKAARVREVAEAVLHRIGQMEPSTRAYIRLCDREEILEKASHLKWMEKYMKLLIFSM